MGERLRGVGVSPGVAVGRAHLLHAESLPVVPAPVPPERVEEEIEAFEAARHEARRQLGELKNRVKDALGEHYAGILEAQLLILDDPALVGQTNTRIRVGRVSAGWALKEVVAEFARRFDAVDDSYLHERSGDLSDVHLRLQRLLRGQRAVRDGILPEGPVVVVAHSLGPSDAVTLTGKGVVGLATDVGGRTSHTAILAQALSVPAVAGLHDISLRVCQDDRIILDGDTGEVQLLPGEREVAEAERQREVRLASEREALAEAGEQPALTRDGTAVLLRANIEFPEEVEGVLRFGARGIGLYRSEFLFLARSPHLPDEEEHCRTYREMARKVAPHPLVIRTLDLGGEKYFHEVLARDEANPVLGLRGVRLCLKRPDIFRPQIRGLLRAAVEPNVRVMLPLVTTVEEIREVRRLLAAEAADLESAGIPIRADVPLGIMIEVPGAAAAADILAREADFLSIGTNDLIQYALAVDRSNESVSYLYQPFHPGVMRTLKFVVESAAKQGIEVSLCGEMAAEADAIEALVGLGLRELSVQPRALPRVREALRRVDAAVAEQRVEQILSPAGWAGAEPKRREPV